MIIDKIKYLFLSRECKGALKLIKSYGNLDNHKIDYYQAQTVFINNLSEISWIIPELYLSQMCLLFSDIYDSNCNVNEVRNIRIKDYLFSTANSYIHKLC